MSLVELTVLDETRFAPVVAQRWRQAAERAISERGSFRWALTGGSAAKAIYPRLELDDWSPVACFFGDERAVPPNDPASNYRLARSILFDRLGVPTAVFRMKGDAADLDRAALEYDALLARSGPLDLVHLGMGPDGHVCSLFPGHPALEEQQRLCLPVFGSPKPPSERLTLTLPALGQAREVWITVAGRDKAAATGEAIEGRNLDLPAARVTRRAASVRWFVDREAAEGIRERRRASLEQQR